MFYIAGDSAEAWKSQLADPVLHWKTGFSAKSLATTWLRAGGIPPKVERVLKSSHAGLLRDIECLLCLPEYKVALPGGSRASQSDIFLLAKARSGLCAIMVEGKCKEPFGELVSEWIANPSGGKKQRLDFLLSLLNLSREQAGPVRYQLLHRTASAVLEARRFLCPTAVMLVHSFANSPESFSDYCSFTALYGLKGKKNATVGPVRIGQIDLLFGWVQDSLAPVH